MDSKYIQSIVRERGVTIPKGMRVEIAIRPGKPGHFCLMWVEVNNRWQCYTGLPGFCQYGRVSGFDQIAQRDLFRLIQDILDECRNEDNQPKASERVLPPQTRCNCESSACEDIHPMGGCTVAIGVESPKMRYLGEVCVLCANRIEKAGGGQYITWPHETD